MKTARSYDHRVHAGNAGDVWKHFLLAEAANYLLARSNGLIYAESHVGRKEYLLDSQGEWAGGVGRCWRHLPYLKNFCYFEVLADINPQGLRCYPGSARLVLEIANRRGSGLHAEVWDVDSDVAATWTAGQCQKDLEFHQGDGFAGVRSMLDRSPPGLLLIDPPYIDPGDISLAEDLQCIAAEKGWVVLWWCMVGADTVPQGHAMEKLSLGFVDADMDCGRWQGATMALAGRNDLLIEHLKMQAAALQKVLQSA